MTLNQRETLNDCQVHHLEQNKFGDVINNMWKQEDKKVVIITFSSFVVTVHLHSSAKFQFIMNVLYYSVWESLVYKIGCVTSIQEESIEHLT